MSQIQTAAPPSPPTTIPVTGTLEQKAVAILTNNCYACHGTAVNGGLTRINEPDYVISISTQAKNFLYPRYVQDSLIYSVTASGRMPLGGAKLPQADIDILAQWIDQGAKAPPAGSTPPPPSQVPLAPTFASLNANIFTPKCVGCHNSTVANKGVRMDGYSNIIKLIDDTRPSQTTLYDVTDSGKMPFQGTSLSSQEMSVLLEWITAGGLNN